ncbi:MAG: hypothetical protein KDN19_08005 [Verrucomicrobiae bacterium]|nr:hypothetical protein [Verrucomicrobiae bacterium]
MTGFRLPVPTSSLALALIFFLGGLATESPADEVTAPPASEVERLELHPFYRKYLSADGIPIVSSEKVSDFALKEVAFLIEKMIGDRPDLLKAIAAARVRFSIMAPTEYTTDIPEHSHLDPPEYWDRRARGIGSTPDHPAVSCGEENLLDFRGDPYSTECIFVHEFAHTIHQQGLNEVDPGFQKRLESVFAKAKLKGLWKGKYAGTNPAEYWAEGIQSWFDCNRQNDFEHNYVNTREELKEYDPGLAALVESVFGESPWRYRKPKDRDPAESAHLAGYDPASAPVFQWPAEMIAAYESVERGDHLEKVPMLPLASFAEGETRSPHGENSSEVYLRVDNRTTDTIRFFWLDFDGRRKNYGQVDPGRRWEQSTFPGHLWLATDAEGHPVAFFAAGDKPGLAVIE